MKLNNWKFYYVDDSIYQRNPKLNKESDLSSFSSFDNVKTPCLFEDIIKEHNLLGDCYLSTNMWDYSKYESYHQYYVCHFNNRYKYLRLLGIDTLGEIYINGKLIGKTNNQFMPYTFPLKNLKKDNELIIHILPNQVEGMKYDMSKIGFSQPYNYASMYLRKTPSSFGWDILPRTCLGGIFQDVLLLNKLEKIDDLHIQSEFLEDKKVKLSFSISLNDNDANRYVISGKCKNKSFIVRGDIKSNKGSSSIVLDKPYLWNIKGYGKPNLYSIELNVYHNETLLETKKMNYGIRKIELFRSSIQEEGGKFEFHINGKKIFLLGSNYVPVEALKHVDDIRSKKAIDLVLDIGCNAIRIWGGGTYETDKLYDYCDKKGIFIWQDFMMGCAMYPWNDKEFCSRLEEEVRYEIKRLRNHPSICLWAGDNENDVCAACWVKEHYDPNQNTITRKLIPDVLKELDTSRPFLPSSPYVDEVAYHNTSILSEDHLWGPRDYFKGEYYMNAYPYFTSETGYHALNSPKSLEKFISNPWPLFIEGYKPTREYLCHSTMPIEDYNGSYAYRIKLMYDQVDTLFTNVPTTLDKFAIASQISQAEAMKFFIEKMRKDYSRNGGIIWWNIIDGWPQISDAVIDYYYYKKIAYSYIKRSQSDTLLMINENKDKTMDLIISSSLSKKHTYTYKIFDAYNDEVLTSGEVTSIPNGSKKVASFINDDKHHFYIIEYVDENGKKYINHFHTNIIKIDLEKYYEVGLKYGLISLEGF